jgi:hypothetical protein
VGKVDPSGAATTRRRTVEDELADPTPFELLLERASTA